MLKHITKNVFSLKLLKTNFIKFSFYGLVRTKKNFVDCRGTKK